MSQSISVAMTTYNGSKYVIEQLESIRMQTHTVDEVVIRDDRSTDNTVELIQEYINLHKLTSWSVNVNVNNLGFADNFMQAIKDCSGDLIFLSDQDDVWYEDKVEVLSSFLANNTEIGCVASSYQTCDNVGKPIDVSIRYNRKNDDGTVEPINLDYFTTNSLGVRGASMCFRSSILDNQLTYRVGTFGHDTIISLYSIIKGKMVFLNKVLFKYRIHDTNVSSVSSAKNARFSQKALNKRVKMLSDSASVILQLTQHDSTSHIHKEPLLRQLDFTNARLESVSTISVFNVLRLIRHIRHYIKSSQYGLIGGWYTLSTDIVFGLKNKQGKYGNE